MSRRPYRRPVSATSWWLAQPRYIRYMARETSCVFIGAYTGVLVVGLMRLAEGAAAWSAYLASMSTPGSIIFHLIALAFALYHTTSWFNLTPKAMPVQVGEIRLPGRVIVGAHYAGWAVLSLIVLFLAGV